MQRWGSPVGRRQVAAGGCAVAEGVGTLTCGPFFFFNLLSLLLATAKVALTRLPAEDDRSAPGAGCAVSRRAVPADRPSAAPVQSASRASCAPG